MKQTLTALAIGLYAATASPAQNHTHGFLENRPTYSQGCYTLSTGNLALTELRNIMVQGYLTSRHISDILVIEHSRNEIRKAMGDRPLDQTFNDATEKNLQILRSRKPFDADYGQ